MPKTKQKPKTFKQSKGKQSIQIPKVDKVQAVQEQSVMEVDEGNGEEEEEEEINIFGPQYIPTYFEFLVSEKPEHFYEGNFDLNRPFRASLTFLNNPHGSVKLYQGSTCALCAVYGPTEVRMSKELPHRASVDVLFRPKITGNSIKNQMAGWDSTMEERTLEAKLTKILESVIFLEEDMAAGFNVILHEFENDGCLFSTCINTAALALLNAGCSMRCTFAAVTILANENYLIVDPSAEQIGKGFSSMTTFVLSNDGHVLHTSMEGKATPSIMRLCLRQAIVACGEIFRFQLLLQEKECGFFGDNNLKNDDNINIEELKIADLDCEDGEVVSSE